MYRVIHLDLGRSQTFEYTFADLESARRRFEELCDEYAFDAVAIEDVDGKIVMQN